MFYVVSIFHVVFSQAVSFLISSSGTGFIFQLLVHLRARKVIVDSEKLGTSDQVRIADMAGLVVKLGIGHFTGSNLICFHIFAFKQSAVIYDLAILG